jgi:hypothetical protein
MDSGFEFPPEIPKNPPTVIPWRAAIAYKVILTVVTELTKVLLLE